MILLLIIMASRTKFLTVPAVMVTLIQTARLNEVDPQAWLADIFARIPAHPQNSIHELLPWNWKRQAEKPPVAKAA